MPWTPYDARTPEQQQVISSLAAAASPAMSASDFYDQQELGLKSADDLTTWLADNTIAGGPSVTASTPAASPAAVPAASTAQPSAPATDDYSNESDVSDVRTLRWLRNNGEEAADRDRARKLYLWSLFQLWRKHVADTGQTYYPPMRSDLFEEYMMISNPDA